MSLETGTTIQSLDASNPPGGDTRSQGAGHLRLIKDVLKRIFPGSSGEGFNTPILATEAEINRLVGVTGPIQLQINSLVLVPIGAIIMWSGGVVPAHWQTCDGTNGTPDLRNKFIVAAGSTYPAGSFGGYTDSVVVSHSHTVTDHTHTVTDPGHLHSNTIISRQNGGGGGAATVGFVGDITPNGGPITFSSDNATTGITIGNATGVTASSAGESGAGKNIPPYYALVYIMRIS